MGSTLLIETFSFIFGAIIGSFLSAAIWRLRVDKSLARGRSMCPHCRHILGVADLVPVFSYLALRGRCRYCAKRIHPAYFLIEVLTGFAFLLVVRQSAPSIVDAASLAPVVFRWAAAAMLLLLFFYDLLYSLVPSNVALVAAAAALAGNLALGEPFPSLISGVVMAAGFFYAQFAFSKGRWIGAGDIYLGAFMGALLGAERTLLGLFLAYVSGAFVGLGLMAAGRATMKTQVPFGTFLMGSAFVAMLYGQRIIDWYIGRLS